MSTTRRGGGRTRQSSAATGRARGGRPSVGATTSAPREPAKLHQAKLTSNRGGLNPAAKRRKSEMNFHSAAYRSEAEENEDCVEVYSTLPSGSATCPDFDALLPPPAQNGAVTTASVAARKSSRSFLTEFREQWEVKNARTSLDFQINPNFRSRPPAEPGKLRLRDSLPPLPACDWAEAGEVWNLMCWKEGVYLRDPHFFHRHPQLSPKMRAMLLDWLSEVSEVYKLHRETFYLAVDFVDRYLSKEQDVPKSVLQLVGVTALFIAAKLEEIYPPKCADFAVVTDGCCSEEQILEQELIMLKRLNWSLSPVTATHWLTTYLQLLHRECDLQLKTPAASRSSPSSPGDAFVFPKFDREHFLLLSRLLDLCLLDVNSLRFPYGVLAASAMFTMFQQGELVLRVSGYKLGDLETCVQWMSSFLHATFELPPVHVKFFENVREDDRHNIQTHDFDLSLLERASEIQQSVPRTSPVFPTPGASFNLGDIFPTPPQTEEEELPAPFSPRHCPSFIVP